MNPFILAGLVKRVYSDFRMLTFDNRLKLQKMIYIMQEMFQLSIGYHYSWYVRGPYSTELTRDAFQMMDGFNGAPLAKFIDEIGEQRFVAFANFIDKNKNDTEWMEIVASLTYQRKMCGTDQRIISEVATKDSLRHRQDKIKEIFTELRRVKF